MRVTRPLLQAVSALALAYGCLYLADAGLFRAAVAGGEGREARLPWPLGVEARDGFVIACE